MSPLRRVLFVTAAVAFIAAIVGFMPWERLTHRREFRIESDATTAVKSKVVWSPRIQGWFGEERDEQWVTWLRPDGGSPEIWVTLIRPIRSRTTISGEYYETQDWWSLCRGTLEGANGFMPIEMRGGYPGRGTPYESLPTFSEFRRVAAEHRANVEAAAARGELQLPTWWPKSDDDLLRPWEKVSLPLAE